ncbi:MAG: MurT ligase domain-containing protein [Candidatus Gastranaerophilales bacterium]|nr:MurT ligase domain-containing protein [Candidatus Gastranaerophilales bacterium]
MRSALELSNKVSKVLKFFNFEATSFPGKVVQKFYPDFLNECNSYINHPRFSVTGTNGKTTTSGILAEILTTAGLKIITNKLGANMPNGIITALSDGLYRSNHSDGVVLECDEAYYSFISSKFVFDYLIVTNLFRDQLDRYGEMDSARKKIIKGIELNPDLKVILNADDPSLNEIADKLKYTKNNFIYYGINSVSYQGYEKNSKSPKEALYCSNCGAKIKYSNEYYAQLGIWYCECGKNRIEPDIGANVAIRPDGAVLDIKYKKIFHTFRTNLTGFYNAYNVLGAISCALVYEIQPEIIEKALNEYRPVFGRHQKIKLANGGTLTIHLIKNPVGASEVLRGLKNLQNSRILISINDNYADGRDVSWLWDADFEALSDFQNVIYTTGKRSYDIALRLKHAGVNQKLLEIFPPAENIINSILNARDELNDGENLVVLVTYTGLLNIQKNMKKLESDF